ncbi:MAG: GNAT family N-acetyltransferase [Clostridia bacterium]|nr:GNAT family N-acetyltransferase [Clostridia bacterium]
MQNTENPFTAFDLIKPPVKITAQRLTVTDIFESDERVYAKLYTDDDLNRFYGYNYREDIKEEPTPNVIFNFFTELKEKKEEYSLAVRKIGETNGERNEMIGEIVIYSFSEKKTAPSCEIGFRFFKDFQGKGYATESVCAVIGYLFTAGINKIKCKCLKENLPSERLIKRLGFTLIRKDDKYFYYELLRGF